MFHQMIDESSSGLHDRLGLVVRHGDHADRGCRPKDRQRVADRSRRTRGVIPGNHDVFEFGPKFAGEMLRTEQKRPAGFEQEGFDDMLGPTVVRLHGKQREIAEAGTFSQDCRNLIRRHLARSALGAKVGAGRRIGECVQELLHVVRLSRTAGLRGLAIVGQHHLRPLENVFLERERGDPGAEVGGDGHTFLDRNQGRPARLADKRQKDVLDGHRDSPWPPP